LGVTQGKWSRRRGRAGRLPRRAAGRVAAGATLVPTAALAVPIGYLGLLTLSAWRAIRAGEHRTTIAAAPTHRFAILVPAHNEERLIADALASLEALDYPAGLVRTHVVADNCTDGTAAIVRAHGVEVHERDAPDDGGKGPALQWLLHRLWQREDEHDAVVIIDADTTVSPNLLRVMDAKLAAGATVVQSYYAVRDAGASSTTAFRSAALAARHYLRPLGRAHVGASVGLYGNGMVFRDELLRTRAWSNHLTEDIEFQLECLLDGTRVTFAPDAVVEAEMPATVEASQTQHERWERGRLDMVRRFVPVLARQSVSGGRAGRIAYADAAIDQLVPPFSLLVAGTAGLAALTVARAVVAPDRSARRCVVATGAMVAAQAAYVLSALRMVDAPAEVYRSLLSAPRLVVWKLGLWARVLARPDDVAWVRTARNADTGDDSGGPAGSPGTLIAPAPVPATSTRGTAPA
jgi:1,2-diacylglycerol 3-beta-glucosyltransferase